MAPASTANVTPVKTPAHQLHGPLLSIECRTRLDRRVLTTLAAKFVLQEEVTYLRWFGVALIVVGSGLITYSEKLKEQKPNVGEQVATVDKAPTLTLAGMRIPGLSAVYTSLGTTTIPAVASLGKDFLKHYRVTLNYAAGTARFEPNEPRK